MQVRAKRVMLNVMESHEFVVRSHDFVTLYDTKYDTETDRGITPLSASLCVVFVNHRFDLRRLFDSLFMLIIIDCQHVRRRLSVFLPV